MQIDSQLIINLIVNHKNVEHMRGNLRGLSLGEELTERTPKLQS